MEETQEGARGRTRWISRLEVFSFYALVLFVIWAGEKWRPTALLGALILVGICVASNKFHHDTRGRIGLTFSGTGRSLKLLLPWVLPVALVLFIIGWPKRHQADWNLLFSILGYPVWGLVQEYTLLGFVANRLEDGWPERKPLLPWINGFLFSLVHLPNPVLMTTTLVAGVLFTRVFYRERNLYAPALVHALVGVGISLALADVYGVMSVGPGYFKRVGNLP